jgi:regulator of PEP synthase PpsR (kinase-PPPase family)
MKRTVYFVSESTGITAETLGHSLLAQYEGIEFETNYQPYINSVQRAMELAERFGQITAEEGSRPIVFATMVDREVSEILRGSSCYYMEVLEAFMEGLTDEVGVPPTRKVGQSHGLRNLEMYDKRIDTINFAMANDDGMRLDNFAEADVILVGVSRSGKTPTCLYLAMHYGLRAANYPLTPDDFEKDEMPFQLLPFRHKMVALTIDPLRLHKVRETRRPGSTYASLARCQAELRQATRMFARLGLPVLDTTSQSIEELAARLVKML